MAGYIGTKAVLLSTTAATVTGNSTVGGDLTVDTNTLFVDSTNNRVGIGTSSPSNPLHVVGEGTFTRGLELGTSGVDATAYVSQYRSTVETIMGPLATRMLLGTVSNHDLALQTNNTERMRIDSSGNVGIGKTASTGIKLDVEGKVNVNERLTVDHTDSGSVYIGDGASSSTSNRYAALYNDDGLRIQTRTDAGVFVSNDYLITTDASGATNHRWNIANSEMMRISSNGNVGLGTADPAVPLHIERASAEMLRLRNTTAGGGSGYISFYETGGSRVGWIGNSSASNANLQINNQSSTGYVSINTNNTQRMRIDSAGLVEVTGGTVILNGNAITALEVTIADDAAADLTFPNRGGGLLWVLCSGDGTFPQVNNFSGFVTVDFGASPGYQTPIFAGSSFAMNNSGALTGTTGTDGRVTVGVAGTADTLYVENRTGSSKVFQITLL